MTIEQILLQEIELPKQQAAQKKIIDQIIEGTGTHRDHIKYYNKELDVQNISGKRDGSFSYEDFVNNPTEKLSQMSARSGGSKSSGYWRDKDNKMRDREGNLV